jgi:hypothetical protein
MDVFSSLLLKIDSAFYIDLAQIITEKWIFVLKTLVKFKTPQPCLEL